MGLGVARRSVVGLGVVGLGGQRRTRSAVGVVAWSAADPSGLGAGDSRSDGWSSAQAAGRRARARHATAAVRLGQGGSRVV